MKSLLVVITLIAQFVFISHSFANANINPSSLEGKYQVGDCTQNEYDSAVIVKESLGSVTGLRVSFFSKSTAVKNVFVFLNDTKSGYNNSAQVVLDSFSITNFIYSGTPSKATLTKSLKLARSATGDRARLVESNGQGQKYFECVFYKR